MSEPYLGIQNLEVMREAHNYKSYLLNLVISEMDSATAALDFGAGLGTFAIGLRNRGVHVICVEPDCLLLENLRIQGFESYDSLDEIHEMSLSYIYSLNVLEHIDDDVGLLAELYQRLKPGGKLLVYVPAFEILFSSMDKRVGHKRRYTKPGLTELLKAAGFEVSQARYVDSLGFLVTLVFKAIGNNKGNISRMALRIFDRFIFPMSVTLDHVLSPVAGKNLLVSARRPLG